MSFESSKTSNPNRPMLNLSDKKNLTLMFLDF